MLRRLASSLIIACAAGCGGPLDVGGVQLDDASELGGDGGSAHAGSDAGDTTSADLRLVQLNKAIEGDWYMLIPDPLPLGGPPQDVRLKLHLESRGPYFGKIEVICIGSACQNAPALDVDGGSGSGGSPMQDLTSYSYREYWLLKADSASKGTGVFTTMDSAATFRVDMNVKPAATLTASFFLEGKFLRPPPPGFYDGGSP